MSEWKEFRLGDISEIFAGGDAPKGNFSKIKTDKLNIPIYSNGISDEGLFGYTDKARVYVPATTVTARGTIGVVFRRKEPYFPIVRLISIIGNKDILDSDFLYYKLKSTYIDGEGSVQAQLTVPMISNYRLDVPPLSTQCHIASILSSLDDKIAVNKKICENLEAQAQALFKHWFVDFAPFKDGKFVESELGLIPEGLLYKRIGDMPHILETGKRPSGGVKGIDCGIPSIGAENIKGLGCYDFSKTKYVTEEFASTMKKGIINGYELLIYKDGGKPGYFIPNFAIFGEGYPYDKMCLNEHVFKLDFGNKGYSLFAYFYFKTKQIMSYLNAQGAKAAIPGINSKDIDAILMPSLENECVKIYCNEIEDVITHILVLSKESSRLSTLRDTLLPKLMSGQIKV